MKRLTVTLGFTMILLWSAMALAITADVDGIIEPGEDPEEELAKAAQNLDKEVFV